MTIKPQKLIGGLRKDSSPIPLLDGEWFTADAVDAGFESTFEPGALAGANWLAADFLADGMHVIKFHLELIEGEDGPKFGLSFGLLPQCQARMRFPLSATDQNRWMLMREGAYLKPLCFGDRVDLKKVDRLRLYIRAKSPEPAHWCMSPISAEAEEPELLTGPFLPRGFLIDRLGQSTLRDWPGKSTGEKEVTARLERQLEKAPDKRFPKGFSSWGGWTERKFESTGFFHTHHDGDRWWLVDPDGHPFWSAGIDCVRVDTMANCKELRPALAWKKPVRNNCANYLHANLERAFGKSKWHNAWATITLAHLRTWGFNTVANWSEWDIAQKAGFPYVRPLSPRKNARTQKVFRDFPDVFHPDYAADAADFAKQLEDTKDDHALIGYFLMNEPTWGFAAQVPVEGMLMTTPECESRKEFARVLKAKYGGDAMLAKAWDMEVTLTDVENGPWDKRLTDAARVDFEAFSTAMVEKLFGTLTAACKEVDPNHLNLGARYYTVPPEWATAGMRCFDVFSVNGYGEKVREQLGPVSENMNCPVIIGEWHFGALDVGLPASGIGHVRDQKARGQAYRVYLEDAASKPWCVGVHWFTLYDQSALGRHDGENYNIGFLDVCNRPYPEMVDAARASHEHLYHIATGAPPYSDAPEYLPMLFL